MGPLQLPVRYWAMHSSSFEENLESNVHHVERLWEIESSELALLLVDMWDTHGWKSHLERSSKIMAQTVAPSLAAARKAGITVVHAPAPVAARKYPERMRLAEDTDANPHESEHDEWPPQEFRHRSDQWERFRLVPPMEPPVVAEAEDIADVVKPAEGDVVVATGMQLHRVLKSEGILHLLYAGFATNSCILLRDYGMIDMRRRGYNTMLLRDCTTAIENKATLAEKAMTTYAVMDIERSSATATSAAFIKACRSIT